MAQFELKDAPRYQAMPEGIELLAEVVTCELREGPFKNRQDPTKKDMQVSFRFKIIDDRDDDKYFGRTIFGNTPDWFTNHPDCKLRIWVQELLRKDELPVGYRFDTEALEGQLAKITIGNYTKPATDGTPVTKDFVESIRRVDSESAEDLF